MNKAWNLVARKIGPSDGDWQLQLEVAAANTERPVGIILDSSDDPEALRGIMAKDGPEILARLEDVWLGAD